MTAVALPASAQLVIGGSGQPNVEVNWAVLDSLGRAPTLADMLKKDAPVSQTRAAVNQPAPKGVQFRPYKAGDDKAKPVKAANKVAAVKPKPAVTPVSVKTPVPVVSPAVAQLVQAAQKSEPQKPEPVTAELPKVAQPSLPAKPVIAPVPEPIKAAAPAGPQISLPEAPKVVPAAPMQIAKVEPPAAKVEPVATAQPVTLIPAPTPLPVPVAAPVVKPEPVPQQLASLAPVAPVAPPAPVSGKSDSLMVAFAADSARLSEAVHPDLDRLVKRLQKDEGLGLQLLAYAEGDDASASKARRLSLSRALEVRKYLMEQGVRSTRIEVRALGNKQEGHGPADRVDALLVNR